MLNHGNEVKHLHVAPEFLNYFEALFPLSEVFSVDFLGSQTKLKTFYINDHCLLLISLKNGWPIKWKVVGLE